VSPWQLFLSVSVACAASIGLTQAAWAQRIELVDEPSRRDLSRYAMSKDAVRAIPRDFEFPRHAVAARIFGIDSRV